ncbi:hypothetical protein SRB5_27770 [Streptomyces sp. RB5]|uniref:Nitroreductase n=1 Tax=Streptomyces smaragdinus TaxID=2585196 RepID=A0A7K0CGN7_9ACTN|nr:hypothetical protein [Streptomyces smaragdinus]MQY12641.1 hypothetical protein [Streptomyces smaragdinus]
MTPAATEDRTRELLALEDHIRRAPSAHNTQPWTLRPGSGGGAVVGWDPARELPAGDPTRRDLYLSLGAFVETALVVAADAGIPLRAEVRVDAGRHIAARLLPADRPYETPYTTRTVEARTTHRGAYAPGRLSTRTLDRLADGLTHTGLMELAARELRRHTTRADTWLWRTPAVVRELTRWLRLGRRPAPDGLTAAALGLTRPQALGLRTALAAYGPLRRLGLPALLARGQGDIPDHDGSVLVLTGRPGTPEDMIDAGRDLVRMWYALTDLGLAVHPLSQLIDCPHTAAALTRRVGARPLAVLRAGRPAGPVHRSARIPVDRPALRPVRHPSPATAPTAP